MEAGETMKKCPIALCRHEIPGSPPHLDLFLGPEGPLEKLGDEDRVARCWRLEADPRGLDAGNSMEIIPLALHRARYLRLAHPVRTRSIEGMVTPLWNGRCAVEEHPNDVLRLELQATDGTTARFEIHEGRIARLAIDGLNR